MTAPKLSHLGVAVQAHDQALTFWRDILGLPLEHTEHVASDGVRVAMLRLDASAGCIELLEPDESGGPVGAFLEKRGPGLHHLALEVDDVAAVLAQMKAAGLRLIDESPRAGAHDCLVAFVHPKSTGGVLVELTQPRPH